MKINIDVPVEQVYVDLERVVSMLFTAETVSTAFVVAFVLAASNIVIKHTFNYRYSRDKEVMLLEAENTRLANLLLKLSVSTKSND
ncbi:hypothetical protein [Neptunomonas japonica]|uniref:hypothetical protein n=1 Tax=Neptunomonas japonica TaxID=417574 RepID=UPI0003F59918|nr:hypothetical protein [Neptunomonas japonica]